MDVTTYTLTIVGEPPGMLQHSTAGMVDADQRVQELRALVAKSKASKRTGAEIDRIASLETELSIYWRDDRPHLPAANVRAVIEKAARTLKDGPRVRRGLLVQTVRFDCADYAPDTSKAEIIKEAHFPSPVKVGRATIMRTRALFREWRAEVVVDCLDELVDSLALERWANIAGRLIGLGDWRPDCSGEYGRFTVESIK